MPDDVKAAVLNAIDAWAINWRVQGKVNDKLIGLWMGNVNAARLTADQVNDAARYCLNDLEFFPVWSQFIQRVTRDEPKLTGPVATMDRIAGKHGAPWWFTLTAKLMKAKVPMEKIGDELMAEAKRKNETLPSGLYLGAGRVS
jgi:hypothetical protein